MQNEFVDDMENIPTALSTDAIELHKNWNITQFNV